MSIFKLKLFFFHVSQRTLYGHRRITSIGKSNLIPIIIIWNGYSDKSELREIILNRLIYWMKKLIRHYNKRIETKANQKTQLKLYIFILFRAEKKWNLFWYIGNWRINIFSLFQFLEIFFYCQTSEKKKTQKIKY